MKKIVSLYIPLLKDFHIRTLDDFVERFYQRMSKERFESILRGYRIVPNQHQEKFVIQALQTMVSSRDETRINRPLETFANPVSSHLEKTPSEPLTSYTTEQVQICQNIISQIDEMLEKNIDNDKRQRLLSKREKLTLRIQCGMIPNSQEEAVTSLDEDSQISFSNVIL